LYPKKNGGKMNIENRKVELKVQLQKEIKEDNKLQKEFKSKLTKIQKEEFDVLYEKHNHDRISAIDEFLRLTWNKGWFWIGKFDKHPAKSKEIEAMYHSGGYAGVKRVVLLPTEDLAKKIKEHEEIDSPIQKEIDLPPSIFRYWGIARFHTFEDCEKDQNWAYDISIPDGINTKIEEKKEIK